MRSAFNKKSFVAALALTTSLAGCSAPQEDGTERTVEITPIKDTIYQPLDVQCYGPSAHFSGKTNGSMLLFNDVVIYIDKSTKQIKELKNNAASDCKISDGGQALNFYCSPTLPNAGWASGQTSDIRIDGISLKFNNPATKMAREIKQHKNMQCVIYATPHEKSWAQSIGDYFKKY